MKPATFEKTYLSLVKDNRIFDSALHESAGIIAKQCALALMASRASVWVAGETNAKLHCLSLYITETDSYESGAVLDREVYPGYFEALANERVIDASDTLTDLRTCDLAESYPIPLNVRSLLDATLRHQGKVNGVLCFEMVGQQRDWTREEQVFVASVGDLVSQRLIVDDLIRSEEKYKALYEHTNDGIGIFADSVFTDVNPAACKIFGGERHEIIGKTPTDLSPEFQNDGQRSFDKAMSYIQKCLDGETQNFEWTHKRLSGENFQADITLNAVRLAGKDTFFSLIRDITDRKEAERQAEIAQGKLEYRADRFTESGNAT
jgi:PAS domain S-box-containing protein